MLMSVLLCYHVVDNRSITEGIGNMKTLVLMSVLLCYLSLITEL